MKFNVYFTIRGDGGTAEMACKGNPIECPNLAGLLSRLSTNLPAGAWPSIRTIGIRVECVSEEESC